MKKLLTIASALFLMSLSTMAQAQLRFGVRGGANFSRIDVNEAKSNARGGFFVGPAADLLIPGVGLGIDAAFMYSEDKTRFKTVGSKPVTDVFKVNRLVLPISIKYKLPIPKFSPFVYAGPEINFNLKDNGERIKDFIEDITGKDTYDAKGANVSMNFGAGVEFFDRFDVFLNYNFGLVDTLKDYDSKCKLWRIGATYYFNL